MFNTSMLDALKKAKVVSEDQVKTVERDAASAKKRLDVEKKARMSALEDRLRSLGGNGKTPSYMGHELLELSRIYSVVFDAVIARKEFFNLKKVYDASLMANELRPSL